MRPVWGVLVVCGGAAYAACGSGTGANATFSSESISPGVGGASGTGASSSASTGAETSSSSGSAGGAGGAGVGGAGGAGCDHTAPTTCEAATELSEIAGDSGSDTRTVKGTTSAWYQVLVIEDSVGTNQLSYTATLVSPPGMVFDLYAYAGDGVSPDCSASAMQATGNPASVSDAWSDTFANPDDRWITLEVRYVSGIQCNPAPEWTLVMKGHTNP